ncbi:ANTAR domain-containing protein [Streptomyces sp. NPDC054864]
MSREMTREVPGGTSRERLLAEAFVELADSLTDASDVAEFLQSLAARCVELLGVSATGVLLADAQGELKLVAASGEQSCGDAMTQVLPLRQGDQVIGALKLFQAKPAVLGPDEIALAQALADVATIAILQRRSLERSELRRGQLQEALTSRIAIEQAKGVLAERWKCTVDEAFGALRRHARANRLRLADCARQVVSGELDTEVIRRG